MNKTSARGFSFVEQFISSQSDAGLADLLDHIRLERRYYDRPTLDLILREVSIRLRQHGEVVE